MAVYGKMDTDKLKKDLSGYFAGSKAGDERDWAGGKLKRTATGAHYERYDDQGNIAEALDFDETTDPEKIWNFTPGIRKEWWDKYSNGEEGDPLYTTDVSPSEQARLYAMLCGEEVPVNTHTIPGFSSMSGTLAALKKKKPATTTTTTTTGGSTGQKQEYMSPEYYQNIIDEQYRTPEDQAAIDDYVTRYGDTSAGASGATGKKRRGFDDPAVMAGLVNYLAALKYKRKGSLSGGREPGPVVEN